MFDVLFVAEQPYVLMLGCDLQGYAWLPWGNRILLCLALIIVVSCGFSRGQKVATQL